MFHSFVCNMFIIYFLKISVHTQKDISEYPLSDLNIMKVRLCMHYILFSNLMMFLSSGLCDVDSLSFFPGIEFTFSFFPNVHSPPLTYIKKTNHSV